MLTKLYHKTVNLAVPKNYTSPCKQVLEIKLTLHNVRDTIDMRTWPGLNGNFHLM